MTKKQYLDGGSGIDRRHLDAIADAEQHCYWYDDVDSPDSNPTLVRDESCDLCVVGGGYTGLWTAIVAKERDPSRDVVLIDSGEVGSAASGRNGGFMESSLTHGVANGQARFPDEIELLEQLGLENLNAIENAIHRYNIDCDYERTGVIDVDTTGHSSSYLDELRDDERALAELGQLVRLLDGEAMRAEVDSPTYTGGLWRIDRAAIVDPARLVWGLKSAAEQLGVRIYEDTRATGLGRDGESVVVTTPLADIRAARVALGTNAFKPLLRRLRHYVVPVYDYCMVTEPLTADQLASIGWVNRQGLSDIPNQFHYYRLTEDDRILWGGYDAVYFWRGRVASELESRPQTWATLSAHFFETFPQLDGIRFSHIWGGAIDTRAAGSACSGGLPWPVAPPTRWATPDSAWPPRGSGPRCARPPRRPTFGGNLHPVRAVQAAAVPAGTVPVRRHQGHQVVDGTRGSNRAAQQLVAHARPARHRVRLVTHGPPGAFCRSDDGRRAIRRNPAPRAGGTALRAGPTRRRTVRTRPPRPPRRAVRRS